MFHLKLTVAYDGTCYHGWAAQPASHGPTIQAVLQERFRILTGEDIVVIGASRTDAGVHARGQLAVLSTNCPIPPHRWPLAANAILPADIAVVNAEAVHPGFDPRREALEKTYTYTIVNGRLRDVFNQRFSYHVPVPIDTEAMNEAAGYLIGPHDFRAFCAAGGSAKTTIRLLYQCRVYQEGQLVKVVVTANGFLYNMVRIIVGTLLQVGLGKVKPYYIPNILRSGRRELAGPTAPPHGLCLEEVLVRKPEGGDRSAGISQADTEDKYAGSARGFLSD